MRDAELLFINIFFLYLRYMLDNLVYPLKFRKMISFLQKLFGMCVYLHMIYAKIISYSNIKN